MKKIKLKLDTLLILDVEPYEEVRYVPANWPKDEAGEDIDKSLCTWNGDEVIDNRFSVEKELKYSEISEAYNQEFITGFFQSESLGIDIDSRRNATKNDLQNVEVLIQVMELNGITETEYKGYEDQKTIATIQQIKDMRVEMMIHNTDLYGKKEGLENDIASATTIEQVKAIKW